MALTLEDYKAMQSFYNVDDLERSESAGGGADRTKVARVGNKLYRWLGGYDGGEWDNYGSIPDAIYAEMGKPEDSEGGGEEGDGEAKPPSFPSTGPVFTPLDITAPSENYDYSYNYPSTYGPYDTGADFQSKGLLNNFGYDGGDPYQPWSQEYGDNNFTRFGGENLWNYQPPSVGDKSFYYDLSKGPGPKVGFAK